MQPTRALWRSGADLMAADTTKLAAATAMHAHLAAAPFTPNLDMVLGDFTEATFTGSAALSLGTGTQPIFYDAETGLLTINLEDPAGGYVWTCTVTPGAPETIYGIYLTDNADAVLLGAEAFANPQIIAEAGQGISHGSLQLQFSFDSPGDLT